MLLADDAETINETLAQVSRPVIEWHFGRGTEPLIACSLTEANAKIITLESAVQAGREPRANALLDAAQAAATPRSKPASRSVSSAGAWMSAWDCRLT